jgi:hypothetical protein
VVLLVCAVVFKVVERTYHDALCVFGECDEDGSLYSNSQHEHRLSPVAMPKSYLGRGLDRPSRLRQTMRQQSTSALRECSIHMSNRNESCDSFPQPIIVMVPQYLSYWLVT